MDTDHVGGEPRRKLKVVIAGDPEAFRAVIHRMWANIDSAAVDELLERMEREPRLMRRFGATEIRHAPLILRAIGSTAPSARQCRGASRQQRRRHRAPRSVAASRDGPRRPDDPEPPQPLDGRTCRCGCGRTFVVVASSRRLYYDEGGACKQRAYRVRAKDITAALPTDEEIEMTAIALVRQGRLTPWDALLLAAFPPRKKIAEALAA